MKSLILLFIIAFSLNAYAEEKEIIIENNDYQMNNVCSISKGSFDSNGKYNPSEYVLKHYQFEFKSKYNVFENYNYISPSKILIKTDLYTIEPYQIKGENKKTIRIIFEEEDMKKLYESSSAKFIFSKSLFSNGYITKPYNPPPSNPELLTVTDRLLSLEKSQQTLQPVISITLDIYDFNKELYKCNEHNNEIQKRKEENNKPINRIKNFFGSN